MKKILFLLSLLALVLVLGACGDDDATNVDVKKEETPKEEVPKKINVNIDVNEETTDGKATFAGTTNLPDDWELLITLTNENGYSGQTKVVIENRVFESEQFSNKGETLEPGAYQVKVIMSIANTQPESIQGVIGEDSKNSEGKLVEDGEMGRSVSYKKEFEVN